MRPRLPTVDDVTPYLRRMDALGIYSNHGPLAREVEAAYADFLGVDSGRCVTAANATLAIQGALEILGSRTWVTPTYTFAATGHAVIAAGSRLVLADVTATDWALDPALVPDTTDVGVLTVEPFGTPVSLQKWAGRSTVVIDAAASLGASQGSLRQLPAGWAVCFSLHATKVLPAGEGGLAVFGSESDAEAFRRWTNFAFDSNRSSTRPATNAKMSEVHAAYALASYGSWLGDEGEWLDPLKHAREISEAMGIGSCILDLPGARPYWIARFRSAHERTCVETFLYSQGIETRRWWPALLSDMPAFADAGGARFPVARHLCAVTLGLPMYRGMGEPEFALVQAALLGALEAAGRGQAE
jgi:dTDP-4-amino-4,6-dideoxygalactose transaminase